MVQYQDRLAWEKQRFDAEVCVHDLPEIFHYWSNKHLQPFINGFGYHNIDDFFVQEIARTETAGDGQRLIASVGSGDCATEVGIARGLVAAGITDFRFVCMDISDGALARGRELADAAGLLAHFQMLAHDFNQGLPEGAFDVVMANQSLHHVLELEVLYDSIKRQLRPNGCFLVSDMIGRNGHVRWPEARKLVDEAWEQLPHGHRYNWLLRRHEEQFMDWDCSYEGFEGVRAQEVLPLLLDRFSPRVFLAWGNIVDVFIDRCFGHNFRGHTEFDLRFIDRVHATDSWAIAEGLITPTHLLGRFQSEAGACVCPPGMTPQGAVRVPRPDDPPPPAPPIPPMLLLSQSRLFSAANLLPSGLKLRLRRIPGLVPLYRALRSCF